MGTWSSLSQGDRVIAWRGAMASASLADGFGAAVESLFDAADAVHTGGHVVCCSPYYINWDSATKTVSSLDPGPFTLAGAPLGYTYPSFPIAQVAGALLDYWKLEVSGGVSPGWASRWDRAYRPFHIPADWWTALRAWVNDSFDDIDDAKTVIPS